MSEPTNRFVLKFNSDIGRIVRLSIPRARTNKDATQTAASMQALIDGGVVATANRGNPASINGAKIVSTTRRTVV
jgi:uncharacterized protein YccT (UPF0319 family)